MTYLPIVERELRVRSRRARTYWGRVLIPLLVSAIAAGKILLIPTVTATTAYGRIVFETLSVLALAYAVLAGVAKTADGLSGEKREGTLGLLFLTDLKGYDVVLGKLAAASLSTIHAMLGMVPVLAWCLLLGGVTFGEVVRLALALLAILSLSLSAGIWISARSQIASRAMLGTFMLVLVMLVVPVMVPVEFVAPLSPLWSWLNAPYADYGLHAAGYWISLLLTPVYACLFLARASAIINRFCEEEHGAKESAPRKNWFRRWRNNPERREKIRTKQLAVNPVMWLADHNPDSRALLWLLVLAVGAAVAARIAFAAQLGNLPIVARRGGLDLTFVGFILLMNATVKTLLAVRACRCLSEVRHNAMLETLLCAPLKVQDILQGQIMALMRRFLGPLILLLLFEMIGLFWVIVDSGAAGSGVGDAVIFSEMLFVILFVLEIQNVAWLGIWFGLSSRNENTATFKTVFFAVLLPMFMLLLYCVGVFFCVIWPVGTYIWARLKLQQRFRYFAAQRPTSSNEGSGLLPFKLSELGRMSAEEEYAAEYAALTGTGEEQN
jgi:ABC-type transport system involved in multi-copper enzyme maturation permease subunit